MRYTFIIGALCVSAASQFPAVSSAQTAPARTPFMADAEMRVHESNCDCKRKRQLRAQNATAMNGSDIAERMKAGADEALASMADQSERFKNLAEYSGDALTEAGKALAEKNAREARGEESDEPVALTFMSGEERALEMTEEILGTEGGAPVAGEQALAAMPAARMAMAQRPANTTALPSVADIADATLPEADLKRFLQLINDLRADAKADPLQYKAALSVMARKWSETMAETGDFKHSDNPVSENIAQTRPGASVQQVYAMWEESPGHKKNMLSAKVRFLGLGVDETRTFWTLVMTRD